jgi:2-keto-4-pentenoate hydratase
MRSLIKFAPLLALLGCVSYANESVQDLAVTNCLNAYVSAFKKGARLISDDSCAWGDISDQALADRVQAGIAKYLQRNARLVGYKVTFADDGRVVGRISDGMLLPSGATIDLSTGARILVEGDLLVRVGSASINGAQSVSDVAAHISDLVPFMESSDMMLPRGTARRKAIWTATNGNARWGVMGEPILVRGMAPQELADMMANVQVALIDSNDNELQRMGMSRHPLESVLDVIQERKRLRAEPLTPGDLISLGNFGRPRFPESGESYKAVFYGLGDETPSVTVSFQ